MPNYDELVRTLLTASYAEILRLGEKGKQQISAAIPVGEREIINAGLLADVRSEMVAQQLADRWGKENNVKIWWASEELEHRYIGASESELVVRIDYDGIDGTAEYKKDRPAGPICSVTIGDVGEDLYQNTVAAGTVVLSDHLMHIVNRDEMSSTLVGLKDGREFSLPPFKKLAFDPAKLLGDWFTKVAEHMLGDLKDKLLRTGASGVTGLLLAKQDYDLLSEHDFMNEHFIALAADAGDKGNHEQPYLYLTMLVHGGMLLTGKGETIDTQPISQWSQEEEVFFVLVQSPEHFVALMEHLPGKLAEFQA